ncbi:MAG: TonB-dependent receptor [Rubrivivax sp.]|nr:TonB-dependent receptor [Rubrivivax sp.]
MLAALLPSLTLLSAPSARAQPEAVTVTATRMPTRVSEVVAEVTVLDRAAIERVEGRTLVELLSQQAGLQFSSNGGLGKAASLFIRGLEARHTLLLVDGVRIASATLGTPSLDNLPLEAVERIEIVRGPMSSLYGSGAMGGVIQVFTRRATQGLTANAKVAAGSHDFGQAAGGMGYGDGVFDAAVQVQHTDTRGVSATHTSVPFGSYNPDRDGFRQTGGSLRLGWQPFTDARRADWRLELLALQSKGLTRIDDGPGADARAELENRLTSVSARGRVMPAWHTRFSAADSTDAYDTLSSASPWATLGTIQTRQRQYGWENTVDTPAGTLLALAERLEEVVSRPDAPFAVSERRIDGLALGLNGSAAGHAWQASLRRDRNSQFGGASTGAVGYGYAFSPAWRLGASYGTSFVAPSFNQLYYPGFGNPLLVPEEGKHGELSLRWSVGEHSLRAAYYEHRYRGFITSGPLPANLPEARIEGLTLAYEGRWRALDVTASYDHTDPRNATAGHANEGKLLPRRAQDVLRLGADWRAGAWSAGATLAGASHRFDDAANTTRLGGYANLDLRAEWAIDRTLSLGVKLNNLGGKAYETALGYPQPGREGFVTLRYAMR